MAITATERTQIVELAVLMFNAAPGATYLSQLVSMYEANGHNLQALAVTLAATPAYQSLNPNFQLASDFATAFLTPLGLQADSVAVAFVTSKFNAGESKGQIAFEAFTALNGITSANGPQYQAAKAILLNKTAVAEFYSEVKAVAELNLSTLQNVLASVTADVASVATAEAAITNSLSNQTVFLKPTGDVVTNAGNVVGDLSPFIFNGTGPTLNYNDFINGVNTLTVVDQFGQGVDIIPAGATLSNIQNVVLNTAGNAGQGAGAAFNTAGISGVQTLTVTTTGAGQDFVTAAATTDITVTQNNQAGAVLETGGRNVTVTSAGAGGVTIGTQFAGGSNFGTVTDVPAGNVTVTETNAGSGFVMIEGGANVTVNVNSLTNFGGVQIGNTVANTGNNVNAGFTNPTGAVSVTSVSKTGGGIGVFGGTSVTVAAAGDAITVGDATGKLASNEATGVITITDTQATTWDNLKGAGHTTTKGGFVAANGGTDVTVTTNTGAGVQVGADNVKLALPTGNVTVTDTASNKNGAFGFSAGGWQNDLVFGGKNVSVTSAGANVGVGSAFGATGTKVIDNPTGTVTVTETADSHQGIWVDGGNGIAVNAKGQLVTIGAWTGAAGDIVVNQSSVYSGNAIGSTNAASAVIVDGGANVTVTTTGGNVAVGSNAVVNGSRQVATGAVSITDTFSGFGGANGDTFTVLGGTTVDINVKNATSGAIKVGAAAVLDATGTVLTNGALDASGTVTINNTNGTKFGSGAATVTTNGATTVNITGAGGAAVTDAQSTLATGGANAGKAIGTSTLATVNLTGVGGAVAITSDALTAVSIASSSKANPTLVTVTDVSKHAMSLTLNNAGKGTTLTDATATSVTVGTSGTSADSISLQTAKATNFTFNNSAAVTVTAATMSAVGPDTVVATGSGALKLGDTTAWGGATKLASIDATSASGAVSAIISGDVTAFKGGSGDDTVTVNETFQLDPSKGISGGNGNDTVILTNVASLYNPILNPNGPLLADFTGFEQVGLKGASVTGTYDMVGFAGVTVNAVGGALALNGSAGETLTFAANPGFGTFWTGGGLVTVGVDGVSAGVDANTLDYQTGGTVALNSVGDGTAVNLITIVDTNPAPTSVTGLTVAGDNDITITDVAGTVAAVTVTNTGVTDLTAVKFNSAVGDVVTGGAGKLVVDMSNVSAAGVNNVFTVNSGAGGVNVTHVGSGNGNPGNAGSETINLAGSAGVRDRIMSDITSAAGFGTRAVVTSFGLGTAAKPASGDVLNFSTARTVHANTVAPVAGVSGSTYTFSNGVATLNTAAVGLTGALELADVQGLLAAGEIAEVQIAGTTYVIAANGGGTADAIVQLSAVTGVTGFAKSTTAAGGGTAGVQMGAGSSVAIDTSVLNLANVSKANAGSAVADTTFADLGFAVDTLTASAAGITNTYANLGNWAELDVGGVAAGKAVVTQVGTAPELYVKATAGYTLDSLTYDGALVIDSVGGASIIKSLVNSNNTATTITITGANTVDIGGVTDTGLTTINAAKATGLVELGALGPVGTLQGGLIAPTATSPLAQAGLNVTGGSGGLAVWASGAGDVITGSMLSAGDQVVANGAGDVIKLGGGYSPLTATWNGNVITANGAGDTISVGNASSTFLGLNFAGVILATNAMIHASGANDTITFLTANDNGDPVAFYTYSQVDGGGTGATTNGIGANSTVSYADNATLAGFGGTPTENVWVRGDLAGAPAADGSVSMITLKNVVHASGDQVTFANLNASGAVLGETWLGQVNVSSVSTLADALNLAAATAAMSSQAGGANTAAGVMAASTGLIDWFQFGGNTYIVEAINGLNTTATHTGLAAGDEVIKIVGLVNLSGDFLAGNTVTL
jgi:hypothetical protein